MLLIRPGKFVSDISEAEGVPSSIKVEATRASKFALPLLPCHLPLLANGAQHGRALFYIGNLLIIYRLAGVLDFLFVKSADCLVFFQQQLSMLEMRFLLE